MLDFITDLEQINNTTALLGLSAIAVVVSLFVFMRSNKKNRQLEQKLSRLERDLRVSNSSAVAMGQELIELEKRVQTQSKHYQSQPKPQPQATASAQQQKAPQRAKANVQSSQALAAKTVSTAVDSDSVYDNARELLSQGLSTKEVAKRSGLSFAEVSLLNSLSKSSSHSH